MSAWTQGPRGTWFKGRFGKAGERATVVLWGKKKKKKKIQLQSPSYYLPSFSVFVSFIYFYGKTFKHTQNREKSVMNSVALSDVSEFWLPRCSHCRGCGFNPCPGKFCMPRVAFNNLISNRRKMLYMKMLSLENLPLTFPVYSLDHRIVWGNLLNGVQSSSKNRLTRLSSDSLHVPWISESMTLKSRYFSEPFWEISIRTCIYEMTIRKEDFENWPRTQSFKWTLSINVLSNVIP